MSTPYTATRLMAERDEWKARAERAEPLANNWERTAHALREELVAKQATLWRDRDLWALMKKPDNPTSAAVFCELDGILGGTLEGEDA
jgi:hypothetical protein